MAKTGWQELVCGAGRMLLAYALMFSQCAFAGQKQKTQDKADSSTKASAQQAVEKQAPAATTPKVQTEEAKSEAAENAVAEEKPSGDGSHEGIKVHGHWTIEVHNPDGTLVTHREFENSLIGPQVLTSCLTGCPNPSWGFAMFQASPSTICTAPPLPNNPLTCRASAIPSLGPNGFTLILTGALTAGAAGSITSVETDQNLQGFTSTNITPVSVAGGQIVQIKVVISFS